MSNIASLMSALLGFVPHPKLPDPHADRGRGWRALLSAAGSPLLRGCRC